MDQCAPFDCSDSTLAMLKIGTSHHGVCFDHLYNGKCKAGDRNCKFSHEERDIKSFKSTILEHFFRLHDSQFAEAKQKGHEAVLQLLDTLSQRYPPRERVQGGARFAQRQE